MTAMVTVRYRPNGAIHVVPEDLYRSVLARDPDYEVVESADVTAGDARQEPVSEAQKKRKR